MNESLSYLRGQMTLLRWKCRLLLVGCGLGRLVFLSGLFWLATFFLDYFIPHLPVGVRLTFLVTGLLFTLYQAYKYLVRYSLFPLTDSYLAAYVERHYPDFKECLLTALDLTRDQGAVSRVEGTPRAERSPGVQESKSLEAPTLEAGPYSPELIQAVVRQAEGLARPLQFHNILRLKPVVVSLLVALLFIGATSAGAIHYPSYTAIWWNRLWGGSAQWPRRTLLTVFYCLPTELKAGETCFSSQTRERLHEFLPQRPLRVARGDTFYLLLEPTKGSPSRVYLTRLYPDQPQETEIRTKQIEMEEGPSFFIFQEEAKTPYTFSVEGGDYQSPPYHVEVLPPPQIKTIQALYHYPPYLQSLKLYQNSQPVYTGNLEAPLGTTVTLTLSSTIPLRYGEILVGGREPHSLRILRDSTQAQLENLEIVKNTYYTVLLMGTNGVRSKSADLYQIKADEDKPPTIKIGSPKTDQWVVPDAVFPLRYEARDDYGIHTVTLGLARQTQGSKKELPSLRTLYPPPLAASGQPLGESTVSYPQQVQDSYSFSVADLLKAKVGDTFEYFLTAEDNCSLPHALGCPHQTSTPKLSLQVTSREQLEARLKEKIKQLKIRLIDLQNLVQREASTYLHKSISLSHARWDDSTGQYALNREVEVSTDLSTVRDDFEEIFNATRYNHLWEKTNTAEALQFVMAILDQMVKKAIPQTIADYNNLPKQFWLAAQSLLYRDLPAIDRLFDEAIQKLDLWGDYQEILQQLKAIKDSQSDINNQIKKTGE